MKNALAISGSDCSTYGVDSIAKKIRIYRKRIGMSQAELARQIGKTDQAISDIESGKTKNPQGDTLRKIASVLKVDIAEFTALIETSDIPEVPMISDKDLRLSIPEFDMNVAAGPWCEVLNGVQLCDEIRNGAYGRFRIKIHGDSMEPAYPNGSLVEFACCRDGADVLEIGGDYYVQRDHEATFKRLAKIGEDVLTFHAINKKKYPKPYPVERADIARMARAEWILKKPK